MAVLARRRLVPDVLLHAQRHATGSRPASCCAPTSKSGPTRSTAATARPASTASSPRATPNHFKNSLYYLLYENNDFFGANGRRLGSLAQRPAADRQARADLQVHEREGQRLAARHRAHLTRAPADRLHPPRRHRDTFFYAYNNGERWISRKIVAAGPGFPSFTSGGATLDHEDPRIVYLSRRTGAFHQVEAWFTPDDGRSWRHTRLTNEPSHYCIRPVTPRGLQNANRVLFSRGDRSTVGFTDFRTRIHALGGFNPPV